MKKEFSRRIFTPGLFIHDVLFLLHKLPTIIGASRDKKIGKAFREKIMTVVTAVNGCTYCTWFHAKAAVSSGISPEEVKDMLNLQFNADAEDSEMTALLYAQHYAETNRRTDPDMDRRLEAFYGKKTSEHIRTIIRMIFFGNLAGNTFDAFLSRLKGVRAPNSSVAFEAFFFILFAIVFLPLRPFIKKEKAATSYAKPGEYNSGLREPISKLG